MSVPAYRYLLAAACLAGAVGFHGPATAEEPNGEVIELGSDGTAAPDQGGTPSYPGSGSIGASPRTEATAACDRRPIQVIVLLDRSEVAGVARTPAPAGHTPGQRAAARVDNLDRALLFERTLDALDSIDADDGRTVVLSDRLVSGGTAGAAGRHVDRADQQRLLGKLRDLEDRGNLLLLQR